MEQFGFPFFIGLASSVVMMLIMAKRERRREWMIGVIPHPEGPSPEIANDIIKATYKLYGLGQIIVALIAGFIGAIYFVKVAFHWGGLALFALGGILSWLGALNGIALQRIKIQDE